MKKYLKINNMKTIQVEDEMYDALLLLSKEMTTQDNRCTSMPHMFQIRHKQQVAAYDGQGEEIWVNEDGDELEDVTEIKNYITQHLVDSSQSTEKTIKDKVSKMDEYDCSEYLEEQCSDDWRKVNVTYSHVYKNTFFTAKACDEHIRLNNYHYCEPVSYLNHAWRNPEMELVSKFLCGLSNKKIHK